MICYIWGAGDPPVSFPRPTAGDLVIAADAGLSACRAAGVTPSVTIGDFDSLGEVPTEGEVVRLPVEKDETDMAAAIRIGLARGYRDFYLLGGTGGRADHTFANYQLLTSLANAGCLGILFGRDYRVVAMTSGSSLTFGEDATGTFSVFAVGGDAVGVTERGVYYPLEHATLSPLTPLGVSNRFLAGATARVSVERGTLLVFFGDTFLPKKLDIAGKSATIDPAKQN